MLNINILPTYILHFCIYLIMAESDNTSTKSFKFLQDILSYE